VHVLATSDFKRRAHGAELVILCPCWTDAHSNLGSTLCDAILSVYPSDPADASKEHRVVALEAVGYGHAMR
jgi:hypothetical protein